MSIEKGSGWKNKAGYRSQEIKKLNKRIKELKESRDNWKNKAMILKNCSSTNIEKKKLK